MSACISKPQLQSLLEQINGLKIHVLEQIFNL